ncbi:tyrosine-type recombinase/integrase [Sinorhizobium saheli]|uniref:Integrase n=1 Tax=Sinorhizobium saheli TaxID=36856 RepID=A0A178YSE5_SINSA|nr:tyrosine-type recombinase/integrase [Sinorhizobium saheli]MQW89627.1 tyrosine-type recombinase/integrase [Sinorhizobium saheli]MQW89638.1 tyrosine-type recombinase/integrase [Sinorhizobium saheli]OAP50532.1 integrase [Sinorhizobium saheli]
MSTRFSLPALLESFFHHRMTKQRNASRATLASYRDALRLLILFAAERTKRKPCALTVADLDRDCVLAFLDELETKRKNTIQTRNARLAAIRSFFHHVATNDPAALAIAQRVLAIPVKRAHTEVTHHLTPQEFDALVAAPDQRTARGRRDRTLLLFLGRTGARVSEALGINVCDLDLDRARPQVLLRGKGRKERIVPIANDLARALRAFMRERGLKSHEEQPLFVGTHGERLTRFGATHIVRRVVAAATLSRPELASKSVSPHVLRHTLAMTLLQSGVDLLTIQAWLGHAQVATTHRYAAADVEMMRRGLDKAGVAGCQPARFQPKDALLRLLETI